MKLKFHVIANLNKTYYCSTLHFVSYGMGSKDTFIEMRKLIFEQFMENCLPKDIASEQQLNIRTVQRILKAYRKQGK